MTEPINNLTPWGPVGYLVYKRTYARAMSGNRTEEFTDTVERIISATNEQLNCDFNNEEIERLRGYLLSLKGIVAGRFLWQLGTKTVDKLGLLSLQNCAVVPINEPVRPFVWAMDALMLGCGVGFNIQREYVYELPKARRAKIVRKDTNDADFIIPDSREGWLELLRRTLTSHFVTGEGFSYSTKCIRPAGLPIKGFGGVSSGPEPLCKGIEQINQILNSRAGKKVRPIDCLDLMNILGMIVVSGNVRRSAQIAIGDFDDTQFLNAKRWDLGNIPNWRAMSNNSVICNDFSKLPEEFWQGYNGEGEPYGLINLNLAKTVGRSGDTEYQDSNIIGFNPCQPEFAIVLTPSGVKQFKDINVGSTIWSKEGWTTVTKKWSTGVKKVYEYRTTGGVFVGTENHRLDTPEGKLEAKDCESVLTISGPEIGNIYHIPEVVMDGLFLGDGYHKKMVGREYTYPCLVIGNNDHDYFNSEIKHLLISKMQSDDSRQDWRVKTSITVEEKEATYNLCIPNRYLTEAIIPEKISLLRGLYSADGSVIKQKSGCRVTYKTASKKLGQQIQQLLSEVGIRSYITTNKSKEVEFDNGSYICKESYDINITKDVLLFARQIGFLQQYKMNKIENCTDDWFPSNRETYTSMKEITYLGEYEVFDITVNNPSHTYWTGGLSVSNCAEQSLEAYETCCLAEIFLPNIESKDELIDVASLLYRINKHSLSLPCHLKETEEVVHRNMRMGIGVTGYLQATEEQKSWLAGCYESLRALDKDYSLAKGFPESIKLTTVKPSGTLSLLAGVTSGCHPGYSQYYIRRIRIASNSQLLDNIKKSGYPVEYQINFDGTPDYSTCVVEFPCMHPIGTKLAHEMSAIDQLEVIKRLQTEWSDNSVSCTVYYRKEELPSIKSYLLDNYNHSFKTLSFLLHNEHGFKQAPLEEITEQEYLDRVSKVTKIVSLEDSVEFDSEDECATGACPVK